MPPLVPRTYSATFDLKDGRSIAASIQGNPSACIHFFNFIIINNYKRRTLVQATYKTYSSAVNNSK